MLKKAGPFKYRRVKLLPEDTDPVNTRFYLFTDQGNFWCPPFKTAWVTFPEEFEQCLEIQNVFAVRLDLAIAAKCHLSAPVDIDIGETIAFQFDIPMCARKQPIGSKGRKGDPSVCGSSRQHRPGLRFVYGQDGKLAVRGMVRDFGSPNDPERGHNVAKLLPQARPTDKTLPVRHSEDETSDPSS